MLRSILLLPLLWTLGTSAQPYKFGCHYFHGQPTHPHQPTDLDGRDALPDIIARSDTFDILHYDITIDVTDYSGHSITAATAITFIPLTGETGIRFELIDALVVDSVIGFGQQLTFTHVDGTLAVELPEANVGSSYTIKVHYQGIPGDDPEWGGFYWASNYIYNLGIGLSTVPPNFGKVWYPCFDSFVERASYTYHVKSAGGRRAHCQGDMIEETLLGGDTIVRTFDLQQEIPTHVSAIAVSSYVDSNYVHTGAYGDIPVRLTAKANVLNTMATKMVSLGDAIDCYEFWYGAYPYDRVGFVLTTDGALEIAENVAYPDFMPSQTLFNNRGLFGHELAHHWWGDHVTPHTHNDMWFKEGPAEYSGHLLEEWIGTQEDFIDVVKDNLLYVLTNAHVQDGGFQALSPMPDAQIYGLHTYYKGAAVLHNLRGYIGDTLFRQAMSAIQLLNGNTDMDAQEFKGALEQATNLDLDPFFDAQVFSPGYSVFTVQTMNSTPDQGNYTVDLQLRQLLRAAPAYHEQVPLDITLVGPNNERQEYATVASSEFTDVTLTCSFEPVMAVLNGHHRLNQARLDHEFTVVPGQSFPAAVPRTAFTLFQNAIVDTTLIRIEHIWAGSGQDPLGWGIDQVSSSHYWNVDGLWPEGTSLDARVTYFAQEVTDLDYDLYATSEQDALLVYRPDPAQPWDLAADITLQLGGLSDGIGSIRIDTLRRGQYAFALGNAVIGLDELGSSSGSLTVLPNPASDALTVRGKVEGSSVLVFDVVNAQGELQLRTTSTHAGAFEKRLDVSALAPAGYVLRVHDGRGNRVGSRPLVISR